MNILMMGLNSANVMANRCRAVNEFTEHSAFFFECFDNLNFPASNKPTQEDMVRLVNGADILDWSTVRYNGLVAGKWICDTKQIPSVMTCHGTELRLKKRKHDMSGILGAIGGPDAPFYYGGADVLHAAHYDLGLPRVSQDTDEVCVAQIASSHGTIREYEEKCVKHPAFKTVSVDYDAKHSDFFKKETEKAGVKFDHIHSVQHKDAMQRLTRAQLSCSEIYFGCYGISAIEAMSIGQPVFCRMDEQFEWHYERHPLVNIDESNYAEKLRELVEDKNLRKKIGDAGIEYVNRVHSPKKIAKEYIAILEDKLESKGSVKL